MLDTREIDFRKVYRDPQRTVLVDFMEMPPAESSLPPYPEGDMEIDADHKAYKAYMDNYEDKTTMFYVHSRAGAGLAKSILRAIRAGKTRITILLTPGQAPDLEICNLEPGVTLEFKTKATD